MIKNLTNPQRGPHGGCCDPVCPTTEPEVPMVCGEYTFCGPMELCYQLPECGTYNIFRIKNGERCPSGGLKPNDNPSICKDCTVFDECHEYVVEWCVPEGTDEPVFTPIVTPCPCANTNCEGCGGGTGEPVVIEHDHEPDPKITCFRRTPDAAMETGFFSTTLVEGNLEVKIYDADGILIPDAKIVKCC